MQADTAHAGQVGESMGVFKNMIGKHPKVGPSVRTVVVLCQAEKSDDWVELLVELDKEEAEQIVPIIEKGTIKKELILMDEEDFMKLREGSEKWKTFQAWVEARKVYMAGKSQYEGDGR